MVRYVIVSIGSGLLFGLMDGLMNGNPLAQRLHGVFEPIARKSLNIPVGVAIDLAYGFAMAGVFLLLYRSLPGDPLLKGLVFGLLIWFFRVVMQVASQWIMFSIPATTLLYALICGLIEMLILGLIYGLSLRPAA
jgi:hypothetical protein